MTKNKTGIVQGGVLGSCDDSPAIATATTPRERGGEVPRMEEKANKGTKFETSSPNTVMIAMMTVDNQADDHHSMSMHYYSGLSSVARELL